MPLYMLNNGIMIQTLLWNKTFSEIIVLSVTSGTNLSDRKKTISTAIKCRFLQNGFAK